MPWWQSLYLLNNYSLVSVISHILVFFQAFCWSAVITNVIVECSAYMQSRISMTCMIWITTPKEPNPQRTSSQHRDRRSWLWYGMAAATLGVATVGVTPMRMLMHSKHQTRALWHTKMFFTQSLCLPLYAGVSKICGALIKLIHQSTLAGYALTRMVTLASFLGTGNVLSPHSEIELLKTSTDNIVVDNFEDVRWWEWTSVLPIPWQTTLKWIVEKGPWTPSWTKLPKIPFLTPTVLI